MRSRRLYLAVRSPRRAHLGELGTHLPREVRGPEVNVERCDWNARSPQGGREFGDGEIAGAWSGSTIVEAPNERSDRLGELPFGSGMPPPYQTLGRAW